MNLAGTIAELASLVPRLARADATTAASSLAADLLRILDGASAAVFRVFPPHGRVRVLARESRDEDRTGGAPLFDDEETLPPAWLESLDAEAPVLVAAGEEGPGARLVGERGHASMILLPVHGEFGLLAAVALGDVRRPEAWDPIVLGALRSPCALLAARLAPASAAVGAPDERSEAGRLRDMERLAGGIAHEINTPAQVLAANLRTLRDGSLSLREQVPSLLAALEATRRGEGSEEIFADLADRTSTRELALFLREAPGIVEQCAEGVAQITNTVTSMLRLAHDDGTERVSVDVNELVANVVRLVGPMIEGRAGIDLTLHPAPTCCHGVPTALQRALFELLENAAEAIARRDDARGRIDVCTQAADDHVVIRITDDGPGISADDAASIFEPYFTTKEVGAGSGHGLTIARRIVADQHEGSVSIESGPSVGSSVVVRLPLSLAVEPAARR